MLRLEVTKGSIMLYQKDKLVNIRWEIVKKVKIGFPKLSYVTVIAEDDKEVCYYEIDRVKVINEIKIEFADGWIEHWEGRTFKRVEVEPRRDRDDNRGE